MNENEWSSVDRDFDNFIIVYFTAQKQNRPMSWTYEIINNKIFFKNLIQNLMITVRFIILATHYRNVHL